MLRIHFHMDWGRGQPQQKLRKDQSPLLALALLQLVPEGWICFVVQLLRKDQLQLRVLQQLVPGVPPSVRSLYL
jgi:hypothetical protein